MHQMLLQIAISQLVPVLAFIFLVRAVYRLFTEADNTHACLVATLAAIAVLVAFLGELIAIAA